MGDVVFRTYPKIFRLGHENCQNVLKEGKIVIQEKLDGANVRWMYDSSRDLLRFGSRKVELTDSKNPGQFEKFINWLKNSIRSDELLENHIYFAEYMIPHTIQYDWTKTPLIAGFDIYNCLEEKFLDWKVSRKLFENLSVPFVPVLDEKEVSEITPDYLENVIPESKYYNGLAEGVVFKNYQTQEFAKLIAEGFKEVNQQTFGSGKKTARKISGEQYLLETYCPPRRVEKIIQAMKTEGWSLDMTMMKELPKRVLQDIAEEEAVNIFRENITVNFQKLRKMIARRCVNTLQREMAIKEFHKIKGGEK